jgi:hypothetical protein
VVHRGDEYVLTWTQGTFEFFFQPSYKAIDGRLVLVLQGTSSSGSLAGRRREMKIEGADNLQALKSGGAFWWERAPEPNGRLVALKVVTPNQPVVRAGSPVPSARGRQPGADRAAPLGR